MNVIRRKFLEFTAPVHGMLRGKKVDLLMQMLGPGPSGSLLDVGGGAGLTGEFLRLYSRFKRVTVVNVVMPPQLNLLRANCQAEVVLGNGCCLPFESQSYDWVFSNAVIEHVGGWQNQRQFAEEIRRVAKKGYFVTTPNMYFPIEPHSYMPFYQFMPDSLQRKVIRLAPAWIHDYASSKEIDLLTPRQFQELFPGANVQKSGLPMIPNSLIAAYRAVAEAAQNDKAA
jgi:ubiquinone/menaquinone biosynthesis C-methylase UbiE